MDDLTRLTTQELMRCIGVLYTHMGRRDVILAELERRLLRAAEIEQHERQRAVEIADLLLERMIDRERMAKALRDPNTKYPSMARAALGEPTPEMSRTDFYHIAFDFLETHAPTVEELIGLLQSVARVERP